MKVKQLIELLKECSEDAEIVVTDEFPKYGLSFKRAKIHQTQAIVIGNNLVETRAAGEHLSRINDKQMVVWFK